MGKISETANRQEFIVSLTPELGVKNSDQFLVGWQQFGGFNWRQYEPERKIVEIKEDKNAVLVLVKES